MIFLFKQVIFRFHMSNFRGVDISLRKKNPSTFHSPPNRKPPFRAFRADGPGSHTATWSSRAVGVSFSWLCSSWNHTCLEVSKVIDPKGRWEVWSLEKKCLFVLGSVKKDFSVFIFFPFVWVVWCYTKTLEASWVDCLCVFGYVLWWLGSLRP